MSKIICIGEALIDMICTDKGKALSDGENFVKKPGGAPTNVAAAIASLGGKVELIAKVGADPFGNHMVAVMKAMGVGTKYMLQDAGSFTTFAFVSLMQNGERDFYFNRGADGLLSETDIEAIDLSGVSIIHFGSATAFLPGPLQLAYKSLLHHALEKNCFISFDPNYRHLLFSHHTQSFITQSWYFLQHCHFFKMSDEEAMLLTGEATVTAAAKLLLDKTRAVFAITLGKQGALLGMDGNVETVAGIPINAVDTTGAGDAFVGAILYQLDKLLATPHSTITKEQWKKMVADGNKAGAKTCAYMGAMEAYKHLGTAMDDKETYK